MPQQGEAAPTVNAQTRTKKLKYFWEKKRKNKQTINAFIIRDEERRNEKNVTLELLRWFFFYSYQVGHVCLVKYHIYRIVSSVWNYTESKLWRFMKCNTKIKNYDIGIKYNVLIQNSIICIKLDVTPSLRQIRVDKVRCLFLSYQHSLTCDVFSPNTSH